MKAGQPCTCDGWRPGANGSIEHTQTAMLQTLTRVTDPSKALRVDLILVLDCTRVVAPTISRQIPATFAVDNSNSNSTQ